MLVKRKVSQKLREVRLAWCDKQPSEALATVYDPKSTVFLTWKGKRLYDSTTCSVLGLKLDGRGRLLSSNDGIDSEGRIYLEAITEEVYAKRVAEQHKREQSESSDDELMETQQTIGQKFRLILKARNMEDYKISANATTQLQKLVAVFREGRNIPDGKDISLYCDGEKLDLASTIGDTDLGDMDMVEVHLR